MYLHYAEDWPIFYCFTRFSVKLSLHHLTLINVMKKVKISTPHKWNIRNPIGWLDFFSTCSLVAGYFNTAEHDKKTEKNNKIYFSL